MSESEAVAQDTEQTPETRSLFEVRDKYGEVWDTRFSRESAEEMRRDMEVGDDMEGVSIKEVIDVQNRYHLQNDVTGEQKQILSFSESEAIRQAWLDWGVQKTQITVSDVDELTVDETGDAQ